MIARVHLTEAPLEAGEAYRRLLSASTGAVVLFSGNVRDRNEGRAVARLRYEAYPEMVVKVLETVIEEARARWGITGMEILQRLGWIPIGEPAVLVLAAHAHRDEAFQAARYGIDELKKRAPLWKKEVYADGTEAWVACHLHPAPGPDGGRSHAPPR